MFIETEELAKIQEIPESGDLRIFDCTVYFTPDEGDQILDFHKKHIVG